MAAAPLKIRVLKDQKRVEITWPPAEVVNYPFFLLRCECPCAGCVNEFTGERTLDPNAIPGDVHPSTVEFSGNYALKIHWSDGHNTGLYSWEMLNRLRAVAADLP